MEDYSSNEKVKPEKQRKKYYMLFGQYVYISIHMCNIAMY